MAGAPTNIYVGDRLGWLKTVTMAGTVMIVGAILQTGSVNYQMILVALWWALAVPHYL